MLNTYFFLKDFKLIHSSIFFNIPSSLILYFLIIYELIINFVYHYPFFIFIQIINLKLINLLLYFQW